VVYLHNAVAYWYNIELSPEMHIEEYDTGKYVYSEHEYTFFQKSYINGSEGYSHFGDHIILW
jgi:hypothetical protein